MQKAAFVKSERHRIHRIGKIYDWAIVAAILVELLMLFYLNKGICSRICTEVGFTGASIAIGILLCVKSLDRTNKPRVPRAALASKRRWGILAIIILGFAASCVGELNRLFQSNPYNASSDILITIQVAVKRLLAGETVYRQLTEWGDSLPLTYLPMHWLPFTIAEVLDFDYRWMAVAIFAMGAVVFTSRAYAVSTIKGIIVLLLVACFFLLILKQDTGILAATVELMVAGYYVLLITVINSKNYWLKGLLIAVCLLSRYILVLWLPLWILVEIYNSNAAGMVKTVVVTAFVILLVYIIPFLSHDWGAFARGYSYYTHAAIGEWQRMGDHNVPYQLDQGVGFARLFYQKLHFYSLPDRIKSLQKVHIVLSLGIVSLLSLVFAAFRKRIDSKIFLLGSFKIYLSVFLAFIQVPYTYLMITAVAVSIAVFAEMTTLTDEHEATLEPV